MLSIGIHGTILTQNTYPSFMISVAVFALNILDCFPTYMAVLNSLVKHDHTCLQNVYNTVLSLASVV